MKCGVYHGTLAAGLYLGILCSVFREDKMSESFDQIPVQCEHMDGVSEPSWDSYFLSASHTFVFRSLIGSQNINSGLNALGLQTRAKHIVLIRIVFKYSRVSCCSFVKVQRRLGRGMSARGIARIHSCKSRGWKLVSRGCISGAKNSLTVGLGSCCAFLKFRNFKFQNLRIVN